MDSVYRKTADHLGWYFGGNYKMSRTAVYDKMLPDIPAATLL